VSRDQAVRGYIDWQPNKRTQQLFDHIKEIVESYPERGLPAPTSRDVYYELLGRFGLQHGYKKSKELQRSAYRLLSLMRRARHIPFSAINDDSYDSLTLRSYGSPEELYEELRKYRDAYHKDLSQNQPAAVRVHCEGAGKVRQFYQVTSDYCVPVYSPGGWDSLAFKYNTARQVVWEWEENDRETVILHAGDLDPDGVGIFEAWQEDVLEFVQDGLSYYVDPEEVVRFKRIMTLPEQVPEHGQVPFDSSQRKEKDYRGQSWSLPFTAEIEAIPLETRLSFLRAEIENLLDHDQLAVDREANEQEQAHVRHVLENLGSR
jgi:hypothetical protein